MTDEQRAREVAEFIAEQDAEGQWANLSEEARAYEIKWRAEIILSYGAECERRGMGMTDEQRAREWMDTQPWCIGYPCDGDVTGGPHIKECPLYGKKTPTYVEMLAAYGTECERRGLERAAKICESYSSGNHRHVADAIRREMEGK